MNKLDRVINHELMNELYGTGEIEKKTENILLTIVKGLLSFLLIWVFVVAFLCL